MDNDLDRRVRAVFAELLRVAPDSLHDGMGRGEIRGWDSLAHITLVARLEVEFSVEIGAELALEIETFGDAKRVVAEQASHG